MYLYKAYNANPTVTNVSARPAYLPTGVWVLIMVRPAKDKKVAVFIQANKVRSFAKNVFAVRCSIACCLALGFSEVAGMCPLGAPTKDRQKFLIFRQIVFSLGSASKTKEFISSIVLGDELCRVWKDVYVSIPDLGGALSFSFSPSLPLLPDPLASGTISSSTACGADDVVNAGDDEADAGAGAPCEASRAGSKKRGECWRTRSVSGVEVSSGWWREERREFKRRGDSSFELSAICLLNVFLKRGDMAIGGEGGMTFSSWVTRSHHRGVKRTLLGHSLHVPNKNLEK